MERSHTVDTYCSERSKKQQEVFEWLRSILMEIPGVEESIKYGMPYYKYYGGLCWINPKKEGVYLGFMWGTLLTDEWGVLSGEKLKQVRHFNIINLQKVNETAFRTLLQEALIINEQRKKKR